MERGPSAHHLLIGYNGLIGLAFEVESVEGWHAVMLSFEGDNRQKRRRAPNLTAATRTARKRAPVRSTPSISPSADSYFDAVGLLSSILNRTAR